MQVSVRSGNKDEWRYVYGMNSLSCRPWSSGKINKSQSSYCARSNSGTSSNSVAGEHCLEQIHRVFFHKKWAILSLFALTFVVRMTKNWTICTLLNHKLTLVVRGRVVWPVSRNYQSVLDLTARKHRILYQAINACNRGRSLSPQDVVDYFAFLLPSSFSK